MQVDQQGNAPGIADPGQLGRPDEVVRVRRIRHDEHHVIRHLQQRGQGQVQSLHVVGRSLGTGVAIQLVARQSFESIGAAMEKHFERFDLILAMDRHNLAALRERCPAAHALKLHLFLAYAGLGDEEVPDPYYGPPEGFEVVLDLCERGAEGVMRRLEPVLRAGAQGR